MKTVSLKAHQCSQRVFEIWPFLYIGKDKIAKLVDSSDQCRAKSFSPESYLWIQADSLR